MDFSEAEVSKFTLRFGDLLVCEGGEPGRAAVWRGEMDGVLYQKALHRVRGIEDALDPQYLQYHLLFDAVNGRLARSFTGSTIKHLPQEALLDYPVRLPPRAEQRRIVEALDAHFSDVEAGVRALHRARANLKRYRASVLKAACEGRLVPTEAELARREGREYETASALLARERSERSATRAGIGVAAEGQEDALPEGWTLATWAQLAERVTVGHVGPMKDRYVDEGIPFLRSQNVRENRFDSNGLLFIPRDFHTQLSKSRLHPGDLVVVRSGSVGVTCVIPEHLEVANCADLVIIQRPRAIEPKYGAYFMNSIAKSAVRRGTVGVALSHFNTKSVAELKVALPPLAEQQRIVAEVERRLSTLDKMEAEVERGLRRAERLRQSILKRAFEGKLVPQDPGDEPASALLERIRAARASRPSTPRSRRRTPAAP